MIRPPPTATRTDTFFPCTTRCRAIGAREANVAPLFGLFRDRGVCRRRPAALEAAPMDQPRDTTDRFTPRFDAAGLVTAIVVDADTRALLMVAHMNDAAIRLTQETGQRSAEHTSELQSLMRISYAVFCLKKKTRYSHRT